MLVTDGEQRAALATVRSLGRAGHYVIVASSHRRSIAGVSRFAAEAHVVPDALRDPGGFGAAIGFLAAASGADVVLPISEAAALAVLARRDELGKAAVPMPDLSTFRAVADKEQVLRAAARLGIATPSQWVLAGPDSPMPAMDRFPIVIKPARSVAEAGVKRIKLGVRYACSEAELAAVLRDFPAEAYPILLQRYVKGEGVGVFLLLWDGELWAQFAHRRIREKPPTGGVSVARESVPLPAPLLDQSLRLLDSMGWTGVAMVEYKIDSETNTAYLMEVNGRLWGSLQLAIDAGVDFPALLVALATGQRPRTVDAYRPVRTRWWWGDIDHMIAVLKPGRRGRAVDEPPSRIKTAIDVLSPFRRGEREEVLRWDDPLPFAVESFRWLMRR